MVTSPSLFNPRYFSLIKGLKYDYGSIMHYSSTIASQNFGKKTMTAKVNPAVNDAQMGQRNGLSATDVEELKRMYCMPSELVLRKNCYLDY